MSILKTLLNPVLFAGLTLLARSRRPKTTGSLQIKGLRAEAGIYRDRWGVPHIYTEHLEDLMFAQGFVHAQDRLWQMDLQRRATAGKLSEIVGDKTIPVDRWMRTLSMRRIAEQEMDLLEDDVHACLAAYSAGVNAAMEQTPRPIEYILLGCYPEPWSIPDTLAWIKMMSWSLSTNWDSEIIRARMIDKVGPQKAAELEPDLTLLGPIIIPDESDYSQIGDSALERAAGARLFLGPDVSDGIGSNNWVISGERTTTGKPIFANDMHLGMSIPSIWYENHLHCPDLQVSGVQFPGLPGIVAGHNGRVAWGYTNGISDVQDLYMEQLRRMPDGRVEYEFKGEWLEAEIFHEQIHVKNQPSVQEEVIVTRHGPIINQLAPDLSGEQPLALRWTTLEKEGMINSLFHLLKAKDCYEFREALRGWMSPVQNVVFADIDGNIAHVHAGKIPVRAKGNGSIPVPGWSGEYEWQGYIPFDELPQSFNPKCGFIVTANNRVVGEDFPYFICREFLPGDRAERITQLIESQEKIDLPFIQRMHFDQVSPSALTISKHIGSLAVEDPELASITEMMENWDGEMGPDSVPAAIYQVFTRQMLTLLLKNQLGEITEYFMGKGVNPQLSDSNNIGFRAYEWLVATLDNPDSAWFDQGGGEGRDVIMTKALANTAAYLKKELGGSLSDWTWGKLHVLVFQHSLGVISPLDRLVNRGPYPIGGDFNTIFATGSRLYSLDSVPLTGPPFRFIADLCDLSRSQGLLAPGQSGAPGSWHYDDQIKAFFDGHYHPMLWKKQEVGRGAEEVLWLIP